MVFIFIMVAYYPKSELEFLYSTISFTEQCRIFRVWSAGPVGSRSVSEGPRSVTVALTSSTRCRPPRAGNGRGMPPPALRQDQRCIPRQLRIPIEDTASGEP